jgi:putative hemin transport protein
MTKTETTHSTPLALRWARLQEEKPKLRIRDAAAELGVSEAQLVATGCGQHVVRLAGDWPRMIQDLPTLGRIMCLTRNEHAVHERFGEFLKTDFFHGMGQVVGPDIDLRLFMSHWKHGFAVTDMTSEGERQSFQFFDASGMAIHKIYLQKESNYGAYGVILNKYRAEDQSPSLTVEAAAEPRPEIPDAEIDSTGFQQGWRELKDTHAFYPLTLKFRVARLQALRLAPDGFARRVAVSSVKTMLEAAAAEALPIMVFIGNRGCIQIHTGRVENIRMFGEEWLNVLDDEFNMHLRQSAIASAWVVRKPTLEGDVTSVEVYDADGNQLAMFFGKRKPGETENLEWRALAASLEDAA